MKKLIKSTITGPFFFILLLSIILFVPAKGQNKVSSYAALFDTLFDSYGNKFLASDLTIYSEKAITPGGVSISSIPTQTCQAGKFILHFDPGSIFTTSSASVVICQVMSDVSAFINSPTLTPSNPIHIFCGNTNTVATPNLIGVASAFYLLPAAAPTNSNQGIILSQVEKGMLYGIDPYANFPFTSFITQFNVPPNTSNFFYSGYINANPNFNWNYNLTTVNIGSNDYDFYTVMLHEASHMLGFGSLISGNGTSKFGLGYNYFSRYDTYLTNSSGNPLLASNTPSCSNSNITFTLNPNILGATSGCTPTATDITPTCAAAIRYNSPTNTNIAVFTPTCFSSSGSLSHFEDMCSAPAGFTSACVPTPSTPGYNDLYFAMCNSINTGSCYIKRYLKPEERNVLCDLGYSVNSTYSCSNTSAIISSGTYSYSYGSACSPSATILGVNDGLSGNIFTYTCTGTSTNIPFATLLANDTPTAGLSVSCIEHISGVCGYTLTGPLTVTAVVGSGLKIFKYLPVNSAGQFGNITYVYVYFAFPGCVPSGGCNLLENGGFQSNSNCGILDNPSDAANISCWQTYSYTPSLSSLFSFNCTSAVSGTYNLGVNTIHLTPPLSSYNGTVNNTAVLGLRSSFQGAGSNGDAMKTNLNAPLLSGQTYNLSFWALNHGNTITSPPTFNPNNDNVVITIASSSAAVIPSNHFPTGLNILSSFTLNAGYSWNQILHTFSVPANTPPQTVFYIGIDIAASLSVITTPTTVVNDMYCFVDDIQLNSVPIPTFSFPSNTINCSGTGVSYTNLAQYASGVTGVFSGSYVTTTTVNNQALYHFNLNQTLLPAGIYPIAFTYTLGGGCSNTVWHNLQINNSLSVTATGPSTFCANVSHNLTLTANPNPALSGTTFTWLPGNITNSIIVISPNVSTIYTVTASFSNFCTGSSTIAVDVYTSCCSPTETAVSFTNPSSILPASLSGSNMFLNLVVVPTMSTTVLSGELMFGPDVKIQVNFDGHLIIDGAHLFACGLNMWDGIEVLPGGKVTFTNTSIANLIEDAKTAVDITGHSTTTVNPVLTSNGTTFNKNFIDINIATYQNSVAPNPLSIKNSVFTCRKLDFTSTQWPQVGASSTATGSTADLRTAINPTTGLFPPYLAQNGMTITTLKSPYSNQSSKFAIKLSDVGYTSSNNFYGIQIGDASSANDFNLFDAHEIFIYGTNSNIKSYNNVFQNTKHSIMSLPGFVVKGSVAAIVSNVTTVMNNNLDLTSTDFNKGNRFWNCHKAIMGNNVYRFNIEKAIFRSTQSTSPASGLDVGRVGIQLNTNRMQYFMRSNEFSNIGNCISVPIVANSFTSLAAPSTTQYGVYAANVAVLFNTISIGSGTNNFINNAVNVAAVNAIPWTIAPDYTTSTLNHIGVKIENNTISDARRGIYVENVTGFVTEITENSVALVPDNLFSTSQHGVHLAYFTAGFNKWQHSVIGSNTLSAQTVTNTLSTLVFCGSNPGGPFSPSVSCNELSDAYQGFMFNGMNIGTFWRGNKMDPMPKGLIINEGEINTQGSIGNPIQNEWKNPTAWSTYSQTSVEGTTCNAIFSKLYVASNSTMNPTQNWGTSAPSFWYGASSLFTTTGSYSCGDAGDPSDFSLPIPNEDDFDSEELLFNAQNSLYRYLHFNDSLRVGGTDLGDFYDEMDASTMGDLLQVEEELYEGNYGTARTILSGLTPTNTVEENCITFYELYANYEEDLETEAYFSDADSTLLFELANICPEIDGHVVYQARALYFSIYGLSWQYYDCSETGARYGTINSGKGDHSDFWRFRIYPNPAQNEIAILSSKKTEAALLTIKDLSGRVVLKFEQSLNKDITRLSLGLINGAYIISITDKSTNETYSQKLFITK